MDLSNNSLTGEIPISLRNLSSVLYISLNNNGLVGPIPFPSEPGELQSLAGLRLNDNHLSGTIPSSLGQLSSLQKVYLWNNRLQGPVPSSIGDLKDLRELYLYGNQLSGELPRTISELSLLDTLSVSHNKIQGPLPDWLTSLRGLNTLDLSFNMFNMSSIPYWLADFPSLFNLYLAGCGIQGEISETLRRLPSKIDQLDLSSNNLTGSLPEGTGTFSVLNLSRNSLSSTVGPGKIHVTHTLDLHANNFSGPIDWVFQKPNGTDTSLIYIDVSDNSFWGEIDQIGAGGQVRIEHLNLSHNFFNRSLPSSIGKLDKFHTLDLSNNNFDSRLPGTLANASGLESLILQENRFTGRIPDEFLKLKNLKELNLSYNYLEGKIPDGKPLVEFPRSSYDGNRGLCGKPLDPCQS